MSPHRNRELRHNNHTNHHPHQHLAPSLSSLIEPETSSDQLQPSRPHLGCLLCKDLTLKIVLSSSHGDASQDVNLAWGQQSESTALRSNPATSPPPVSGADIHRDLSSCQDRHIIPVYCEITTTASRHSVSGWACHSGQRPTPYPTICYVWSMRPSLTTASCTVLLPGACMHVQSLA